MDMPQELLARLAVLGEPAERWMASLERQIADLSATWGLEDIQPFAVSHYNLLMTAISRQREVVLKICPVPSAAAPEIAALTALAGTAYVRVLAADAQQGALLLERLRPGTPLFALPEEDATRAYGELLHSLPRPVEGPKELPDLSSWGQGFSQHRACHGGTSGPLPDDLFREAEMLFEELLRTTNQSVLLHGDLHHGNVLVAREGLRAIDPKGVYGEPCFEATAYLRNHLMDRPNPRELLRERVAALSRRMGWDPTRMLQWTFAQSVLSAVWDIEDRRPGGEPALACARLCQSLLT